MARVFCNLPNAGNLINGVEFVPMTGGMLSDDIGDEAAAAFLAIPGYSAVVEQEPVSDAPRRGRPPKETAP